MNARRQELEQRVQALLADPANQAHPLGTALRELWEHMGEHVQRLERITALSDSYQWMARERERGLCDRFENQVRRISRIVRISDQYQSMLRDMNARLQEISSRDPLTEAPNRRVLMDRLQQAHTEACNRNDSFVIAMLDVDHFKQINDCYGHDVGDRALVMLSELLCSNLRDKDICGRWGGEEFLLILPETTLADARAVLARKLQAVRTLQMEVGEGAPPIRLTMSAG
nr:GGDEF domain-containing protein [Pseudomonas sp.]